MPLAKSCLPVILALTTSGCAAWFHSEPAACLDQPASGIWQIEPVGNPNVNWTSFAGDGPVRLRLSFNDAGTLQAAELAPPPASSEEATGLRALSLQLAAERSAQLTPTTFAFLPASGQWSAGKCQFALKLRSTGFTMRRVLQASFKWTVLDKDTLAGRAEFDGEKPQPSREQAQAHYALEHQDKHYQNDEFKPDSPYAVPVYSTLWGQDVRAHWVGSP